ncbi:MAG: TonB-dependent receptor [Sphingomonas sp.]|uniref:TonB-dependent receptor plug domain-containing protein n=1 Tax=Sphingomonas sp. TaxID=28214 RepID=UPI0035671399
MSLLAVSVALFATMPAFAQDAAQDCAANPGDCVVSTASLRADVVVTATGVEQPVEQIGQAVTVVERAEIERRQTVSISDLLATTPGVTVSRNGGPGNFTGVRIRGAEGEQTLTLIDGVRVNDPSSPGGGFDFGNLLAGSVERIEVLRGPNSVPWGSQALGGVVNIVTATPTEGLQGRGSVEYGSHDTVFANAGVSGGKGAVTASLTGGYLRTDGVSSAAIGTEPDGYRQYGGTGSVNIAFTDGIGLDLRGYYAHSRLSLDGYPPPNYFPFQDTAEYSTAQEIYGYAGLHANLLDGRFRNKVAFTIADINRDNFDPSFGTAPSFFGRGRSERYTYQGDFQLVDQVRLVGGAEHENSSYFDGKSEKTGITSFYGEAIVRPIDQLTVTGGVRHDDHRKFGGHTSFAGNAALALGTGTILRASYAEGFKAPTLYQLFSDYGNERLKPETARNYDVGIEQKLLEGRFTARATYFHRDTKGQIDFVSCPTVDVTNPNSICYQRPFGTYDNIARTRAQGVEVELELRPIDDLTLTGNVSYIDSENRSPGANFGKDLARRPKETASVSVDYRLPFGLSVGGTISVVGDSYDDVGNFNRLDGYSLASLRAEFPIGDRLTVYGRVENLFDEKYQTVATYGTYGRTAFGGIRVKFD